MALLNVDKLSVHFGDESAPFRAVDRISYSVKQGEVVGIVGESGSGKSVSSLAIMGLIDYPGRVMAEKLEFNGQDLQRISEKERRNLVGAEVAMIFQDPSSALNPVIRVGRQICEALRLHRGLSGKPAQAEALRLMDMVGIPDPRRRFNLYPHEFSGGQCQRLMIAMALAGEPDLLIADEPTTALDATIQAQILDLLATLRRETGMATVFISHDLGAVAQVCERVCVMYAGRIVEAGPVAQLFAAPRHPYTRGLFDAIPRMDGPRTRLIPIDGTVPDPRALPAGCAFAPRCARAQAFCRTERPELLPQTDGRLLACAYPVPAAPAVPQRERVSQ